MIHGLVQLVVLFFLTVGVISQVQAQQTPQEPQYDEAREAEIAQKAKKRIYPGGRDEEELKVQAQIVTPVRKVAPQAEVREESSEE